MQENCCRGVEIALCSKLNSIAVSIASPLLTQNPPSWRMLAHMHCKVVKEKLYMVLPAAVPILVLDVCMMNCSS